MYSTCLFCNNALGANEALEHFPVGRKLAFDAAKGRLWVVCPKCERWNLSPLEERWEAIEEAERAYRDTRKRVATHNIGLARVADGTDLIRIGTPLRPEFAAWRYGDVFARRAKKTMTRFMAISAVSGIAGPLLTHSIGITAMAGAAGQVGVSWGLHMFDAYRTRTNIVDATGVSRSISQFDAAWTRCALNDADDSLRLTIRSSSNSDLSVARRMTNGVAALARAQRLQHTIELEGVAAMQALSQMLPIVNQHHQKSTDVQDAVALVEGARLPADLLHTMQHGRAQAHHRWNPKRNRVAGLPTVVRFALEMSLHEDDERRALEGELHVLEQRWKDAEEIAAIADGLLVAPRIDNSVRALRDGSERG